MARWLVAASLLLLACGSGDGSRDARDEQDGPPPVPLTMVDINVCPLFLGSLVVPQQLLPGEAALVAVRASDPDDDDRRLTYSWSASSGEFAEPGLPITEYRCAELGEQKLTVHTKDQWDCDAELHLDVTCMPE
jgi:hypothetical protein